MKKNKKGFSMVEILAVVVLLGLLSTISIVAVSRYKNNAINNDYEALAKSSYNAMKEYLMVDPYKNTATLEFLEKNNFLSNRKDPATKESNCNGVVLFEAEEGTNGNIDKGDYTVYLCCSNYKRKYLYPEGKIEKFANESFCDGI